MFQCPICHSSLRRYADEKLKCQCGRYQEHTLSNLTRWIFENSEGELIEKKSEDSEAVYYQTNNGFTTRISHPQNFVSEFIQGEIITSVLNE